MVLNAKQLVFVFIYNAMREYTNKGNVVLSLAVANQIRQRIAAGDR